MRKKLIARHKTEEEIVFGLRYDEDKQELFVGGPDTMQAAVTEAMRECFELMTDFAENNAFKKGHRMRLLWRDVSPSVWKKGVLGLAREYRLQKVRCFRRLTW